jgi:hypothetical protein
VKRSIRRRLEREKQDIVARLAPLIGGKEPKEPGKLEFNAPRAKYEIAERVRAVPYGGLAAMHDLVRDIGLLSRSRAGDPEQTAFRAHGLLLSAYSVSALWAPVAWFERELELRHVRVGQRSFIVGEPCTDAR